MSLTDSTMSTPLLKNITPIITDSIFKFPDDIAASDAWPGISLKVGSFRSCAGDRPHPLPGGHICGRSLYPTRPL